MHHQILEPGSLAALGGAHAEEQARHGDDALTFARNEDLADRRVGEDRLQRAPLLLGVRLEFGLVGEEHAEELHQLGQVLRRGKSVLELHGRYPRR